MEKTWWRTALFYLRKLISIALFGFGLLIVGAGSYSILIIRDPYSPSHLFVFGGIVLIVGSIALWSVERRVRLLGICFVAFPLVFPLGRAAENIHFRFGLFNNFGIFLDFGFLAFASVCIAIGGYLLLRGRRSSVDAMAADTTGATSSWSVLKARFPSLPTGASGWLKPLAYMIVGGLAVQGLISIFGPRISSAPPPPIIVQPAPTDFGVRFATAAFSSGSLYEIYIGKTPQQSLEKAQKGCPYCRYLGPERGRCLGYMEFWIASSIYVIADDAATAEAKAYTVCLARYGSSSCGRAYATCRGLD